MKKVILVASTLAIALGFSSASYAENLQVDVKNVCGHNVILVVHDVNNGGQVAKLTLHNNASTGDKRWVTTEGTFDHDYIDSIGVYGAGGAYLGTIDSGKIDFGSDATCTYTITACDSKVGSMSYDHSDGCNY